MSAHNKSTEAQPPALDPLNFPAPDLTLDVIRAAHRLISPRIHRTPVITCASLDQIAGAQPILQVRKSAKDWLIQNSRRHQRRLFSYGRTSKIWRGRPIVREPRRRAFPGSALARNSRLHRDAAKFFAREEERSGSLRRANHRKRAEHRISRSRHCRGDEANRRASGASLQRCAGDRRARNRGAGIARGNSRSRCSDHAR